MFRSNPGCAGKEGYRAESSFVKFETELQQSREVSGSGGEAGNKSGGSGNERSGNEAEGAMAAETNASWER